MHKKFPSIEQFKNVIRNVKYSHSFRGFDNVGEPIHDFTTELPTLRFEGTVKLHGTNAAVVLFPNGGYHCQGRNRVVSLTDDNAGFAAYVHTSKVYEELRNSFTENGFTDCTISIYGEWCGGNIQKGVALNGLQKMFVIFAIRIDDHHDDSMEWITPKGMFNEEKLKEKNCYLIDSFKTYSIDINFNHPELVQNEIISLTEQVENECPVGKAFGVSGIGEGIVWKCVDIPFPDYWFKVKGEKHSVSKVKTLASVDTEKVNSIIEFSEKVVTENRLNQGIEYLKEMGKPIDMKSTGDFIRWVFNDVMKEEIDTIVESGLDVADIGKYIAEPSKRFWFKFLKESENV